VWRADFAVLLALNPGQLFGILHSVAAALKRKGRRIIVFQDCSAQYAALPAWLRVLKRGAFYLLKGPLYALGMAVSSAVFANTPDGVQLIRRIPFGGCCRYLPLAYDEDVYYFSEAEREQVRNEMGWSAEIVVITTGRAIPEKKLERLIDAFEVLASSGAAVRLILSGVMADDYGNAIRRKAQLSPARNRISVFGFISRERTRQLLNAADIGVWPRQPAISIQQAMGTGLFCVLPKNLYVGHLLTDKTGSYFESDNWSEMTTVLATAIRNASMFETHCRVRRAEINRRFCSAAVAQTLVESFCSVLPFGLQPRPAGTGGAQTYE
jgi:glycosyltransferase involved in cell wall biosynthesis